MTPDGSLVPEHNFFSKVAFGLLPGHENFGKYVIALNLPEHDKHWQRSNIVGKASMSKFHRFLLPVVRGEKNNWRYFNAIAFDPPMLPHVKEMKQVATAYAHREGVSNPLLYVHVYPDNSIPYLHVHIVDGDHLGPTHAALKHKNLLLDDVISVLQQNA